MNPLLFLAPLNGSLAFQDRAGVGTLVGSGAVRYRPALGARVNYFANPGLGTDDTGWTDAGNATGSRVADADFLAGQCWETGGDDPADGADLTMQARDAALSGATLTVGIDAKRIAGDGDWTARAQLVDAAGTLIGDPGDAVAFAVGDALGRIVVTLTAPVATGAHGLQVQLRRASASAGAARFGDVTVEVGSTDGSWFAPIWLDPLTGILGTAHASPSVSQAAAWVEEGTTNLLLNPSAEVDATTGCTVLAGATITRETAYAALGSACFKIVTPNVVANEGIALLSATGLGVTTARPYAGSMRLRGSGTVKVEVQIVYTDASSTFSVATNVTLTDAWQEIKDVVATASGTKTVTYVALIVRTPTQQAATIYLDCGQVEDNKTYSTSYTDGSLGTGYAWAGTPHASASTRANTSVTFNPTNRLSLAKGEVAARALFDYNPGNAHYVFSHISGGGNRVYLYRSSANRISTGLGGFASVSIEPNTTADDTWVTTSVAWDGATGYLTKNGSVVDSDAYTLLSTLSNSAAIGSFGAAQQLNGYLGPVAIFDRPLTDAERARLNSLSVWNWQTLADRVAEVIRIGAGSPNAPGVLALGGD